MRKPITKYMIEISYDYAKKVYHDQMDNVEGIKKIEELSGMGRGSARDYIKIFAEMMSGNVYTRTMNIEATEYYLNCIKRDYGVDQLRIAISSVNKHVKYYASLGRGQHRYIGNFVKELEREVSPEVEGS